MRSVEEERAALRLVIRRASKRLAELESGLRREPRVQVPARKPSPAYDVAAVRAWAREKGIPVGVRGRLPGPLVERYLIEHAS